MQASCQHEGTEHVAHRALRRVQQEAASTLQEPVAEISMQPIHSGCVEAHQTQQLGTKSQEHLHHPWCPCRQTICSVLLSAALPCNVHSLVLMCKAGAKNKAVVRFLSIRMFVSFLQFHLRVRGGPSCSASGEAHENATTVRTFNF